MIEDLDKMKPNYNYGFIIDEKDKRDFQFGDGKLTAEVLQEDGQWDNFLPVYEAQSKNGFESMNCWNFGTHNCIETLLKRKYNIDWNGSERYICVLAGGTVNGGMPRNAIETMRTKGDIPEEMLPFDNTITSFSKFSSPNPMTKVYLDKGQEFLDQYTIGYDYVRTSYGNWIWRKAIEIFIQNKFKGTWQEIVKEALKMGPLGVSVCAWKFRNSLAYKNSWDKDNHWIELYGYKNDQYDQYWKLYDHYTNCYVKAEWNYPFGFIMRYTIYKNNNNVMLRTIKQRTKPEYYVVSESNPTELTWVGGWDSYTMGINNGWLKPVEEVENLDGFTVVPGVWGIIK